MSETKVKLKREEFNVQYRFREAREEGLVVCASCASMTGVPQGEGVAYCNNLLRAKKVKITQPYWKEHSAASKMVCDSYSNKPLPSDITIPILQEGQAILLSTQFRNSYHADPKCPYVLEELRIIRTGDKTTNYGRKGEIVITDILTHIIESLPLGEIQ